MKAKAGQWTEANIDKYLKSPADYAPGNAMAFAGIPNAKDRADLVAYLKTKTAWSHWNKEASSPTLLHILTKA